MDIIDKILIQNRNNLSYLVLNILKESNKIDKDYYENTLEILKKNIDNCIIPKNFEKLEIDYINVLLISDSIDSKTLCDKWNKMSKDNNYKWNKINLVWNEPCDYYCIINNFPKDFKIIPEKTILFQMDSINEIINSIYFDKFKYVGYNKYFLNNFVWGLSKTYNQLLNEKIEKDNYLNNVIFTISDDNYKNLGEIKKVDFIKFLEKKGVNIHIYGGNKFLWKNYKEENISKIFNYKYVFNVENSIQKNYCTERLIDGILSECLVFYSGCYNIKEYIDPRAYVYLELSNFEEDLKIIEKALKENWWEQKLPFIKEAKIKILNELQFFPRLEKIINNEFKISSFLLENENEDKNKDKLDKIENYEEFDDYYFYPNKDSYGGDLDFHNNKSIRELIADKNNDCIGFNTYGYLKKSIKNEDEFIYLDNRYIQKEGLYVKKTKNILKLNLEDLLKKYKFFPKMDHLNDDICFLEKATLEDMINYCEKNDECISFNTLGFMKNNFNENNLQRSQYFSDRDGIFVNIEKFQKLKNKLKNVNRNYKMYCINLEERNDRKEIMKKNFKNLEIDNYDFYKGIDGQKLVLTEYIKNMFLGNDFCSKKEVLGRALSHYNIWLELLTSNYDYFIIFEDDIIIDKNFINIKNIVNGVYILNDNWDILHLGYIMLDNNIINKNINISNKNKIDISLLNLDIYIGGLTSYVISKNGAKKLSDFIKNNGIKHPIDYLLKKFNNKISLNQYEVRPHLFKNN
jgi:GR25 family glycosyltransferase involved in LPS biosynthesis